MIVGDAGGDPAKIASGSTNGSVVLSPDGLKKKKKIKSFAEFTEENIVERWNPFSDLDNHRVQNFFMGSGKIKDAIVLFGKMLQRVDAGKWNYAKRPLDILADLTNLKPKLLAFELRKAGYSDDQIYIK
jgi:hypothetical protein